MENPTLLAHDHAELDGLLAAAFSALARGEVAGSLGSVDFLRARLAVHIRAEHFHLFPALLRAAKAQEQTSETSRHPALPAVQSTIARLQEDHDFHGRVSRGREGAARSEP